MTKLTEKTHEKMTAETEAGKEKIWLIVNRVEAIVGVPCGRAETFPAPPLDIPTLNLEPLDAGQKRDTQFLVHVFIENPIDDRLLHQKGLVERQKFLFRLLIIGLCPEQQLLKIHTRHLAMRL